MKILYVFALIGVIVSITTIGGTLISATAQPNDNNLTRATSEPLLEGNLTSNLGSNLSNATIPATDGNQYR
jgi:hypothetical protein